MSKVIAIGALGGSGTRAVAQVFIDAGVYMGDELNGPNDNLAFSRLMRDPIFAQNASQEQVMERLNVFKSYMENDSLNLEQAKIYLHASRVNPTIPSHIKIYLIALKKLINSRKQRDVWGWKEPNTQIYISQIQELFDNLKYVHVIRHGLDMAFSKNKEQLKNWGYLYDINLTNTETDNELAYKQMDYWVKSTKDTLEKASKLGNNMMVLNHSVFCQQGKQEVERLLQFAELEVSKAEREKLYTIPQMPKTTGRYKNFDLSIFDQTHIDFMKDMSFEF